MDVVSSGHLKRIDTLRGVAIAAVILYHFYGAAFGTALPAYQGLWIDVHDRSGSWWLLHPLGFGWTGVALFFVISGYVIHRSYLLDPHFTWSGYASRRFWRIYPAYFVVLVGVALWWGKPLISRDFVLHALLLHNVSDTFFYSINVSFWSLAVECQLYALYPLALLVRSRFGVRGMLTAGCIAAAFWTIGAYAWAELPPPWATWSSPIALWPDWLLGAALAEYHRSRRRLFQNPLPWALASGALCVAGSFSRLTLPLVFSLASVTSAVLVEAYLASKGSWDRRLKPLGWLGLCSYSVYLCHEPLLVTFLSILSALDIRHPALQIVVGAPVFLVMIFGIGWMLYVFVEKGAAQLARKALTSAFRTLSPPPPSSAAIDRLVAPETVSAVLVRHLHPARQAARQPGHRPFDRRNDDENRSRGSLPAR